MPKLITLTPQHTDFSAVEQLMESAFPINERPLTLEQILALSDRVSMDLLGIYPDETPDRFAGFFLTLKGGPFVYLSFFAICPENRSSGLGSKAIGALREYYQDKQLLFSYESTYQESDNAQQRERRRAFYLKNGFYETGWFISVGNAEFILASSKEAFDKEAFIQFMAALVVSAGLPNNPLPELYRRDTLDKKISADLVVYGKIFTSENNKIVEAFAVKDGKYVYVGDRKGAECFIEEGKTEVLDYTGKGLVMPSCGNGHAHYMLGFALNTIGTTIGLEDDSEKFLKEIVPAAVKKARESGATSIFGQGWRSASFESHMPTRLDLDSICDDIPMYFLDEECHQALANTTLLKKAGIIKEDGTAGKTELRGGEIKVDADGMPTGLLSEQAQTYVRSFLDNDNLYSLDRAISNLAQIEQLMLSEGYTMYHEGWGNYFANTNYYKAAQQLDQAGKLHFVLGLPYEIESWMDKDEALARAIDARKFASKRVMPRWIKLLMDGSVEAGTGLVEPLYPDGHQGIANWTEEEMTELARKANANGLTLHVHSLGNKSTNMVVNAFINGGKDEMRNTLVHVRNVIESDYKRMKDHNIYATSGVTWHHAADWIQEALRTGVVPAGMEDKSYPFKSFFDYNIPVSIHSDYPALSGSPDDPFGIMEIAVTGVMAGENGKPWWTEECVTREQALTALTINCARQMFIEDERGSISIGKYADFLLVDKDVLTCPETEIHEAKPAATYFEGKKVFSK